MSNTQMRIGMNRLVAGQPAPEFLRRAFNGDFMETQVFRPRTHNGLGYLKYHKNVLSPYLWSGTQHYTKGKYIADGKFSSTTVDKQLGTCAILKRMQSRGLEIGFR